MKLSHILEATHSNHPAIQFIKSVPRGADDYITFPLEDIEQVAELITKHYGPPKFAHRDPVWFSKVPQREWAWDIDDDQNQSYKNVYLAQKKTPKGRPNVAKLSVEHSGPEIFEATYHGTHPIIEKVEEIANKLETREIKDEYGIKIDAKDIPTIITQMDRMYDRIDDNQDLAYSSNFLEEPAWEIRYHQPVGQLGESSIEATLFTEVYDVPYVVVYIR